MEEIAEYRKQISAIDSLLAENGEDEELLQTKRDLEELIELMSEEIPEETPSSSNANQSLVKETEDEEEDLTNLDDLLGTRCMAPFKSDSTIRMHTAVIMDIQPGSDESNSKIRVLFSHPTCSAMKPCSHFLNSNCRFDNGCRFSHGYLVDLNSVEDYAEPNFESVNVDCLVLVKSSNDIWELGRISAMDAQLVAVKLLKTNQEVSSTLENIMPVPDEPEEPTSSSEATVSWPELKRETMGNVGIGDVGKWEGGGIGMKLMMKMGYQVGQGLGKKSDGIVHAIQAKICPKNASVDECMNKKKRKVVDGSDNIKKKKIKKLESCDSAERDIFAFINRKLEKKSANPTFVDMKEEKEKLASYSVKSLGVKGVDLELELKQLKAKEKKLKEGINRNKMDKNTVARLTQSLKEVEAEMENVRRKQSRVHNEMDSRKMKKKDIF